MESRPDAEHFRGELLHHRDMMVLKWLSEQYAARVDHLEVLINRGKGSVYDTVSRLRDAGYVRTRHILVGERMWVTPTNAGLKQCGLPYREVIPKYMHLAHIAAINDVRLHIQGRSADAVWICERQVAIEYPRVGYLPDGLVVFEGRTVAIEVELTAKAVVAVRKKLYKLERSFDVAMYFCAPKPYRQLRKLEQTGDWSRLEVRELPNPGARRP